MCVIQKQEVSEKMSLVISVLDNWAKDNSILVAVLSELILSIFL